MSCSNCFNGCAETTSDKCIKYTGIDVPVLGIRNGDSLSFVEQAIIQFLASTLDGSGIVLDISEGDLCILVNSYLPACGDLTLIDLATALTKSACSLQTQVTALEAAISVGEAAYNVGCLPGVSGGEGTHVILQAVIDLLCSINTDLTALTLNVENNYVAISDIDTYISAYLGTVGASTLIANKMVPYVAVEYYGSISYFDATGAGIGDWAKIYLCNGNNSTPDKRGRVGVGVITGMGGGTLDAAVNPATAGNPAYTLYSKAGVNIVTLDITQIPSHNHSATLVMVPHSHAISPVYTAGGSVNGHLSFASNIAETTVTSTALTTSTGVVTIGSQGGGLAHANNQPALACLYIIYIP